MEKLLTIGEASELLGLKVQTLYTKVGKKDIPHFKIGSRVMFSPTDLENWVAEKRVSHAHS